MVEFAATSRHSWAAQRDWPTSGTQPQVSEVGNLVLVVSDTEARSELMGYLITTANAHHEATGGVNPQWAEWYAGDLIGDVNRVLDADMSVDELAEWLIGADRRYREEGPEMSWPKAYASWLLAGPD